MDSARFLMACHCATAPTLLYYFIIPALTLVDTPQFLGSKKIPKFHKDPQITTQHNRTV